MSKKITDYVKKNILDDFHDILLQNCKPVRFQTLFNFFLEISIKTLLIPNQKIFKSNKSKRISITTVP
jgi:hypothetical protein